MKSVPSPRGTRRVQYAALPYRQRQDGEIQIRLITSRETRRWVIPKGWPMKDLSPSKAAAREAYEEAGLLGSISSEPLGLYSYDKRLTLKTVPCDVMVFPLKVKRYVKKWPERSERFGFWFSVESAAAAVQEEDLRLIILAFGDLMAARFAEKRSRQPADAARVEMEGASPAPKAKKAAKLKTALVAEAKGTAKKAKAGATDGRVPADDANTAPGAKPGKAKAAKAGAEPVAAEAGAAAAKAGKAAGKAAAKSGAKASGGKTSGGKASGGKASGGKPGSGKAVLESAARPAGDEPAGDAPPAKQSDGASAPVKGKAKAQRAVTVSEPAQHKAWSAAEEPVRLPPIEPSTLRPTRH